MVVDRVGDVYVAGHFGGVVDFDPGAGTTQVASAGGTDAYVLKLLVRVMVGLKTPGSAVMVPELRPVAGLMVRPVGRPVAE